MLTITKVTGVRHKRRAFGSNYIPKAPKTQAAQKAARRKNRP